MENQTKIKCPNCGTAIDVEDILSHQLEERIKKKLNAQLAEEKKKYEKDFETLNKEKKDFEKKKQKENELFTERLDAKLKEEKKALEEKIKKQFNDEQSEQFARMQKELNEKSEQIKELNITKAEIEKLKREKEEIKGKVEADAQKKLNQLITEEKEKIKNPFIMKGCRLSF